MSYTRITRCPNTLVQFTILSITFMFVNRGIEELPEVLPIISAKLGRPNGDRKRPPSLARKRPYFFYSSCVVSVGSGVSVSWDSVGFTVSVGSTVSVGATVSVSVGVGVGVGVGVTVGPIVICPGKAR